MLKKLIISANIAVFTGLFSAAHASVKWYDISSIPGVYWRYCSECEGDAIGDQTYNVVQIWCKKRDCGNIYIQANLIRDDVVVGWTNATGYGSKGQKVNLTLASFTPYDNIELTHLNLRK